MTEAEWLNCESPQPMLATMHGRISEAQARRFAVACCRRVWGLILSANVGAEAAVETAATFASPPQQADARRVELCIAAAAASAAFAAAAVGAEIAGDQEEARNCAAHAAFAASALTGTGYADEEAMVWSVAADAGFADDANHDATERKAQADLLRTIVGNPFALP